MKTKFSVEIILDHQITNVEVFLELKKYALDRRAQAHSYDLLHDVFVGRVDNHLFDPFH